MPNRVRVPFGTPEVPPDRTELGEALGIRHQDPYGVASTHILNGTAYATIGQLVHENGVINCIPREGLTDRQAWYLNAAAEDAFFGVASPESGWEPDLVDGVLRWTSTITVTAEMYDGQSCDLPMPSMPANRNLGSL